MNSLKKQILIKAPLEKVWAILGDVARMSDWVDGVKESERTGSVKEGVGLRWCESCELGKQCIETENEMTVWEPMSRAVIQSSLPMNGTMTRDHHFFEKPEGVEVVVEFSWNLGIAGMILGEEKVRNILDQSFENTLANWKDLAEKTGLATRD